MVCGTSSNSGKSTIVAGLCRVLARRGLSVAPFKAQNMALNSAVTASGHEIGRAQYLQAQAAKVAPSVEMNPVLLKPTSERESQVVLQGRPYRTMDARQYHDAKPALLPVVLASLDTLRRCHDAVVLEGAGSPAEINLLDHDIVNLRVAAEAEIPAVVVGDIDLGGVFAALHGTVTLLPPDLRRTVKGFVINKFRGDPALLRDGLDELEQLCGVPTLGVVPMVPELRLDAEDSVALSAAPPQRPDARLDVAVVAFPRISNFTDIDPLMWESDVSVRFVRSVRELGRPDLVVLPGSKATVEDLDWMRTRGIADAVAATDAVVLGICGGYQMLGARISDEVESRAGCVRGLGLLDVFTVFEDDKVLAQCRGEAFGADVCGYQIHHGRVHPDPNGTSQPWLSLTGGADAPQGASSAAQTPTNGRQAQGLGVHALDAHVDGYRNGPVLGTTLHGLFDSDGFRHEFLAYVADRRGTGFRGEATPFCERREAELDRLADCLEEHVAIDRLLETMGAAQ